MIAKEQDYTFADLDWAKIDTEENRLKDELATIKSLEAELKRIQELRIKIGKYLSVKRKAEGSFSEQIIDGKPTKKLVNYYSSVPQVEQEYCLFKKFPLLVLKFSDHRLQNLLSQKGLIEDFEKECENLMKEISIFEARELNKFLLKFVKESKQGLLSPV